MSRPKVSIIVPVYNTERFLPQCLDSILAQTYSDWECLLIDDGSTDNSGKICDEYSVKDGRFRVYHEENHGVSTARNIGLANAGGEWLAFADADDWLLPDALSYLYNEAITYDVDIVTANALRCENGKQTPVLKITDCVYDKAVVTHLKHHALWGQMLRKAIIDEAHIRFVDGLSYSEDWVFLTTFSLRARRCRFADKPVYCYRIHKDSACQSTDYMKKVYHTLWAAREFHQLRHEDSIDRNERRSILKQEEAQYWQIVRCYLKCGKDKRTALMDWLTQEIGKSRVLHIFVHYYYYKFIGRRLERL